MLAHPLYCLFLNNRSLPGPVDSSKQEKSLLNRESLSPIFHSIDQLAQIKRVLECTELILGSGLKPNQLYAKLALGGFGIRRRQTPKQVNGLLYEV